MKVIFGLGKGKQELLGALTVEGTFLSTPFKALFDYKNPLPLKWEMNLHIDRYIPLLANTTSLRSLHEAASFLRIQVVLGLFDLRELFSGSFEKQGSRKYK